MYLLGSHKNTVNSNQTKFGKMSLLWQKKLSLWPFFDVFGEIINLFGKIVYSFGREGQRLKVFFNGPTPTSFCLFLVFSNKQYVMSIQYMAPGFEPMTFGTHNHQTGLLTQAIDSCLINDVTRIQITHLLAGPHLHHHLISKMVCRSLHNEHFYCTYRANSISRNQALVKFQFCFTKWANHGLIFTVFFKKNAQFPVSLFFIFAFSLQFDSAYLIC